MASLFRPLLWIGAVFYFAEAVVHFFGLPMLEHDKIFLPTDDRYIAIMGLTYGVLLILISTDINKYRSLFLITMAGIAAQALNAICIDVAGGYRRYFPTQHLDSSLRVLGVGFLLWYLLVWLSWRKVSKEA